MTLTMFKPAKGGRRPAEGHGYGLVLFASVLLVTGGPPSARIPEAVTTSPVRSTPDSVPLLAGFGSAKGYAP